MLTNQTRIQRVKMSVEKDITTQEESYKSHNVESGPIKILEKITCGGDQFQ